MRYLKAFAIGGPLLGLLGHFMASEPMPWWPDTVVFGALMGAPTAFLLMRLAFARRAVGHLLGAGRALRRERRD
jgi:hypothetical protein